MYSLENLSQTCLTGHLKQTAIYVCRDGIVSKLYMAVVDCSEIIKIIKKDILDAQHLEQMFSV